MGGFFYVLISNVQMMGEDLRILDDKDVLHST